MEMTMEMTMEITLLFVVVEILGISGTGDAERDPQSPISAAKCSLMSHARCALPLHTSFKKRKLWIIMDLQIMNYILYDIRLYIYID